MKKLFIILTITFFTFSAFAADGDLDTSFAGSGFVNETFTNGFISRHNSVVVQPNGKIISAGHSINNVNFTGDFSLIRYNADGTLDTTFGTGGRLYADVGGRTDTFPIILLQPDGKIVAVGWNQNSHSITARFFNTDSAAPVNNPALRIADFDGDGKTDVAVWRNGIYYVLNSSNGAVNYQYFGASGDKIVASAFIE